MLSALNQFGLLLWKNFLLQRRKFIVTLLEIGIPGVFALILLLVRFRVVAEEVKDPKVWKPFWIDNLPPGLNPPDGKQWVLAYSPVNNKTDGVMNFVARRLTLKIRGFETENQMLNLLEWENVTTKGILGGIVFSNFVNDDEIDKNITYKIRLSFSPKNSGSNKKKNPFKNNPGWLTQFLFPLFQTIGPREKTKPDGGQPGYYREGFSSLQRAIDEGIILQTTPGASVDDVGIRLQRFPYPPYINDNYILVIQKQFSLILTLSFVFSALNIVKNIVHEKERKLKESMKMMGLSNWLHWSAWSLTYLILLAISSALMTLLFALKAGDKGSVINRSDPSVIFVFLMLYSMSTISFCFLVSVFFSKANSAAAAGGIFFFLSNSPYAILQPRYDTLSWYGKILPCLISNVAMSFGGQVIGMFEGNGEGVQWSNLSVPASVDDDFTMFQVFMMLIIDTVLYGIITWYVEAIKPGEYGIPKPWYFPVTKSYWCGSVVTAEVEDTVVLLNESQPSSVEDEFFEKDPPGRNPGIRIRNLTKDFGNKVAVDNMCLDMFDGQITALLGHNGAGKTTTMSMLTGLFPPTSGTAQVNGYDIRTDISRVRNSLGLCPQHNVLFDELTVEEHLQFFCKLKGHPAEYTSYEVDRMLASLDLEDKRTAFSRTLSGGMKRKLSVGIALIGGSKIVMLDEPTSGMDPEARRHTWDILQRHRDGRTMILTTHFMDEADLLGDRIAIMANGVVQCCGSSMFLKKKYGAGYHMTIVKQEKCNVANITAIVQKYISTAQLSSNVSAEVTYILPNESADKFEKLFTELENRCDELGINSYGASVTTMEEVFIKVGENSERDQTSRLGNLDPSVQTPEQESNSLGFTFGKGIMLNYNSGIWLMLQQFYAMFIKRMLHTKRNWLVTTSQLVVPLVFTIIALSIIKTMPKVENNPPLSLSIGNYENNIVPFSTNRTTSEFSRTIAEAYSEYFNGTRGKPKYTNEIPKFENDSSITNYLISRGEYSLGEYQRHYIVGAAFYNFDTVKKVLVTAMFNDQTYHAIGTTLNTIDGALLRLFSGKNYTLTTVNHPLPQTQEDKINAVIFDDMEGFTIAFNVMFGMAFLAASFTLFLIKERSTKAKHLQVVSGVNEFTFWASTFCWDLINFLFPVIVLLVVFVGFDIQPYVRENHLGHIFLLLLLYGWAILPFMYLLSYIFSVPSTGLVWLTLFNILSGIATVLAVDILSIPQLGTEDLSKALEWVFLITQPNFCMGQGLTEYYQNDIYLGICTKEVLEICDFLPENYTFPCCKGKCGDSCIDFTENFLSFDQGGIGRALLFQALQGVFYFLIVFIIDSPWSHFFKSLILRRKDYTPAQIVSISAESSPSRQTSIQEDDDVESERLRVASGDHRDSLVIEELTKYYGGFLAVNRLSVGIPQGECFGLLGVNGAGKTTTFKMLTGDETISSGSAFLNGFDVRSNIREVQRAVGYCPQFDAIIDQMTGRETLYMFARLRGVKESIIGWTVTSLIKALTLEPHANKLVSAYSGGNKRKLSTAIALVGNPPIVFLDEPTTGVDPVARRLLWDTLSKYRDEGRTLVLTSHSMEECEALCTRLAIMVNGQFKCLGSTQHLKSKFGEGYTLMAKVGSTDGRIEPDPEPLMNFIEETFPGSKLKDVHLGLVHYQIPRADISWAQIFGIMERSKSMYRIEDYSVSQTTLEQVFINFARSQREPQEDDSKCCRGCCSRICCCCFICRNGSLTNPDIVNSNL